MIDKDTALDEGVSRVWDNLDGHMSFDWATGDSATVEDAFSKAAHITRVDLEYPRVVVAFMEPRAAIATHDHATIAQPSGAAPSHRIVI